MLTISSCDSLVADQIFQKNNKITWTETKPKSVVEAVLKLDTMTNDFNKHIIKVCDPVDFHLAFGMDIRNEWVYSGEEEFRDQLFNKLKIKHPDYSSGLILWLFREYIKEGEIKIMDQLGKGIQADSMKIAREEYLKIEYELNKTKKWH